MISNIIAFKYQNIIKATLIIYDNESNQVIIRFIPYGDEHYTLHRQADNQIILTNFSSKKQKSTWDDARIEIAKKLGYKNPEKHGQYYQHRPIPFDGFELGGRRINLNEYSPKIKYQNNINLVFDVSKPEFMLKTFFNSKITIKDNKINTTLGTINFEFE